MKLKEIGLLFNEFQSKGRLLSASGISNVDIKLNMDIKLGKLCFAAVGSISCSLMGSSVKWSYGFSLRFGGCAAKFELPYYYALLPQI